MKILIVEDSPELALEVKEYLSGNGYICKISKNCEEALEEINSNDYDIMLLDLGLPDGSGFDVLKSIRKTDSKVAVIIITAQGELEDRINGLQLGADDYLNKTFCFNRVGSPFICHYSKNARIYC